ncbi:MAG: MBL fold metallo-hydrolase [Bacteroidales bacterium]|nr:MBL fold metallo-hydrolase [Bacteroidales bacterium]MBN2821151.1 MBL fold metallo-hydrolase [Bacteroidales bacterium]
MKITRKIHALRHDFKIHLPGGQKLDRWVYSYIVFGDYITLIDTGLKMSYKKIYAYIESQGRHHHEIDKIILSHSHPDHMGSAQKIKKDTGCVVFAHETELDWIENIEIQFNSRPVPGFFDLVDRSVEVDVLLEEGDKISPSGFGEMRIIHTPGHSPGSISILFPRQKIFFTGDTIPVKGDVPNYLDYKELMGSIQRIKSLKIKVLLTSWQEPLKADKEIQNFISEGEEYLKSIDKAVKLHYKDIDNLSLTNCRKVVSELELPALCINPIVNKAFCSHL